MSSVEIEIDLVKYLLEQAQNPKEKETSLLRAHALVKWLIAHYFPLKIRKSSLPLTISSPNRGKVSIQFSESTEETSNALDSLKWERNALQALKKIKVEDLGHMNATELESSIPLNDPEGRGIEDLNALEKKFCVKVVFDSETDHVLLVGDEKKLEKKVFVIRNMLSHYHWRLSGYDVAFDKATAPR